jgi:CRISPR-associated protein Cmr2
MNENNSLLLFSLGPVQSFIAEARRTHDLWAGSKMLVEITRAAIAAIDPDGKHLIFPAHVDAEKQKSIPNVFAMLVPHDQATTLANTARQAAQQKFEEIAGAALQRLRRQSSIVTDGVFDKIWQRQLKGHLECNWVACAVQPPETHGAWYNRAREALDARKRTRDFRPAEEFGQEKAGAKDSLSGQRLALHAANQDAKTFWQEVHERLSNKSILQPHGRERLDAIGLAKRFSKDENDEDFFPSTSSVASLLYLQNAAPNLLRNFKESLDILANHQLIFKLPNLHKALAGVPENWQHDGIYFYEDRLTEEVIARELGKKKEELSQAEKSALRAARHHLRELYREHGRPPTYYAVLLLDGDKMGEHISTCDEEKQHRDLSDCLEKFAKAAYQIVGKDGCVIYAGGDDVMALVPLKKALFIAQALREKYAELFKDWPEKYPPKPGEEPMPFTCSAGIAMAHHLSPLDATLQEAREVEKRAKDSYGRNALSITAMKRSGEPVQVGAKWKIGNEKTPALFLKITELFENEKTGLAEKFPYEAAREAFGLIDIDTKAHKALLRRLLKRHGPKIETVDDWAERLSKTAEGMDKEAKKNFRGRELELHRGPIELANWLLLARFLAQGGNE